LQLQSAPNDSPALFPEREEMCGKQSSEAQARRVLQLNEMRLMMRLTWDNSFSPI
jgi:hypothetical protein